MKKILFITGSFLRKNSPNGLCIQSIVTNLENNGVHCDVVCLEEKVEQNQNNVYQIIRHPQKNLISRTIYKVTKFLFMPVGDLVAVKLIKKTVINLYNANNYDAIISVMNPAETVQAISEIINKIKCKFIIYEIDPASNRYRVPNGTFQKLWTKRSVKWENKVYSSADKIVHMLSHKEHFSSNIYDMHKEKVHYLDIPYLDMNNYCKNLLDTKNSSYKRFIYAGSFYPELRDPYYFLDVIKKMCNNKSYMIDVYSGKRMRAEIEQRVIDSNTIHIHDFIPQEDLNHEIEHSDFVLSVGNKDSDFLPSKVLYYISTGKPIIHFCKTENDPALQYFHKYENALIVYENDSVDFTTNKINEFINGEMHLLSKDNIREMFQMSTPEYTAAYITNLLWE